MSFQDKRKDATEAKAVIEGLAASALGYLQAPEVRNSERAVEAANQRIEQAQSDIDEAVAERTAVFNEVQSSSPEEDLAITKDERSNYQQELIKARLAGSVTAIAEYDSLVKQADQRIIALGKAAAAVALLNTQIAAHEDALATATQERDDAVAQQTATDSPPTPIFSAEGQSVVRKTRVVKTAAAAVVAGFPIAIGVVLLLDAAQKRRARRQVGLDDDDELAAAVDDEHEHELEAAPTSPVSPSPALIGAAPGPAGLPAAAAIAVVEDEYDEYDEYEEYDEDVDDEQDEVEEAEELDEVDEDDEDEDEDEDVVVEGAVDEDEDLDDDIDDELDDIDDELDDIEEDAEEEAEADAAVDDAQVLHELDEEDLEEAELDEADLDEAELDELVLAGLDEEDLDEAELDEADLGDDLDEELEDDVAATVASRRRMYNADIDDDLSVDGGSAEYHGPEQNGPQHNGLGRVWARVPAADADFDGDDEAGADR
jgi:hypothetical protein